MSCHFQSFLVVHDSIIHSSLRSSDLLVFTRRRGSILLPLSTGIPYALGDVGHNLLKGDRTNVIHVNLHLILRRILRYSRGTDPIQINNHLPKLLLRNLIKTLREHLLLIQSRLGHITALILIRDIQLLEQFLELILKLLGHGFGEEVKVGSVGVVGFAVVPYEADVVTACVEGGVFFFFDFALDGSEVHWLLDDLGVVV